jgi:hypothetical protein
MAYNRVDVDNDFVYQNFSLSVIPTDIKITGYQYIRYSVNCDNLSGVCIGIVEYRNGKWLALNDPSQEHRDLIDSVKRTVNVYLKCQIEFEEFKARKDLLTTKQ